jgi:hypothetical protein
METASREPFVETTKMDMQEGDLRNSTSPTQHVGGIESSTPPAQQAGELENSPAADAQPSRNTASIVLPSIAIVLATLALLGTGFNVFQISQLRQEVSGLKTSVRKLADAPKPAPVPTPSPTIANTEIQPGQFVQPAFGTKARVELLSVKRIASPETGNRDVVNVQLRIRRLAADDKLAGDVAIYLYNATARNSQTGDTYGAIGIDRSTGGVFLSEMRKDASADAYVWLRIPEGINTIDVYIPDTQVFKNVPISN